VEKLRAVAFELDTGFYQDLLGFGEDLEGL
jgi:hypothetical protein